MKFGHLPRGCSVGAAAFRRHPNVVTAFEANHLVLMDPSGKQFFGLDEVGARIWQLLDGARTVNEVAALLATEYDADMIVLCADVEEVLRESLQAGLVELVRR